MNKQSRVTFIKIVEKGRVKDSWWGSKVCSKRISPQIKRCVSIVVCMDIGLWWRWCGGGGLKSLSQTQTMNDGRNKLSFLRNFCKYEWVEFTTYSSTQVSIFCHFHFRLLQMEKSHGMYFYFPRIWPKSANLGADQTESFLKLKD